MKKNDVQIGQRYYVNVSGSLVPIKLIEDCPYGGWYGKNEKTGREIRIKTAQRLRGEA